jgi:hypothetical protein
MGIQAWTSNSSGLTSIVFTKANGGRNRRAKERSDEAYGEQRLRTSG